MMYDFEKFNPPPRREQALRAELERRRLRRQTTLLAAAGALMELFVLLLGLRLYFVSPVLTVLCMGYALFSAAGSLVIALVFVYKGGKKQWQ